MMKNILLGIVIIIAGLFDTASATYSNYNNYQYNNQYYYTHHMNTGCPAWIYKGYKYWDINNWSSVNATKVITNWRAYVKIHCQSGTISRTIIRLDCDTGYSRDANYCKRNSQSTSYNNHHNNNVVSNCPAWTYNGYKYWYLHNWSTTDSSKDITHWKAYAKIHCNYGKVHRIVRGIKCDSGYYRSGNYCKAISNNNHYNNSHTSYTNNNCSAWIYNGYRHWNINNWEAISSYKDISNWRAYAKIHCINGNISRTISSLDCDSGYSRESNYCKINPSHNSNYNTQNTINCPSWTYNGYSYSSISNWNFKTSSKNITNWKAYAKIYCNYGKVHRVVRSITCDSGYYRSENYCKQKSHYNNNHSTYTHNNSCNAWTYNGYNHTYLKNGQSVHSSKIITNWKAYVDVVCRNWSLSRIIKSISCNSGYYRSENYCKASSNQNNTRSYHH